MFGRPKSARETSLAEDIERRARALSHDEALEVVAAFCRTIGRRVSEDHRFMLDAWNVAERGGYHFGAVHYYSPIATNAEIHAQGHGPIFGNAFGVELDATRQRDYLAQAVFPHLHELKSVPFEQGQSGEFFWSNGMFDPQDTATYYGMIRHHRPRRVLEVGSGFSTLVAAKAARANGDTMVECIEPYPIEFFNKHLARQDGFGLIEKRGQDVPLEKYEELEAGDILFIDSSHVAKPGSDVEFLIFKVLPVLKPGVLVHFHDIFMPRTYHPDFYLKCHWYFNENYIVAAYLADNPHWRVLLANNFLTGHGVSQEIARAVSSTEDDFRRIEPITGGGSLWVQKRPA